KSRVRPRPSARKPPLTPITGPITRPIIRPAIRPTTRNRNARNERPRSEAHHRSDLAGGGRPGPLAAEADPVRRARAPDGRAAEDGARPAGGGVRLARHRADRGRER